MITEPKLTDVWVGQTVTAQLSWMLNRLILSY